MNELKDFFFLGKPIQTEIGEIDFIRLKDYPLYTKELSMLRMNKKKVLLKNIQGLMRMARLTHLLLK